jgi:hypothetical protein
MHTNFWSENLEGRHHTEDLGADGKIILEVNVIKLEFRVAFGPKYF